MVFEQRPNTGTLFGNRELASNQGANMKGDALLQLDGSIVELDIAAWLKESPKAGKFYSLSVKLKQSREKIGDQPPPIDDDLLC
jgi:hypothetical protein